MKQNILLFQIAICFFLCFICITKSHAVLLPHAQDNFGQFLKFGVVATKGIILDDKGNPIWVEYDEEGKVVNEINEMIESSAEKYLGKAWVMASNEYRQYVKAFETIRAKYHDNYKVLSRDAYLGTVFSLVDDSFIERPTIKDSTRSVVVPKRIYNETELFLLESPLDLKSQIGIPDSAKSVLLNEEGQFLYASDYNIGHRTAFYSTKDENGEVDHNKGGQTLYGYKYGEDKLWGPIVGATVKIIYGAQSTTDQKGQYNLQYFLPPCMGFPIPYPYVMWTELRFNHFNPKAEKPFGSFYEWREGRDFCIGGFDLATMALFPSPMMGAAMMGSRSGGFSMGNILYSQIIEQESQNPDVAWYLYNFSIDVAMLSGEGIIRNEPRKKIESEISGDVVIGDDTFFVYAQPEITIKVHEHYDFDGDSEPDKTILKEDEGVVEIFFDDNTTSEESENDSDSTPDSYSETQEETTETPENLTPTLTRRVDYEIDLTDRGLLQQISVDDFLNTDIYVYRSSNNQLLNTREGLDPIETDTDMYYGAGMSNSSEPLMFYQLMMRGPESFFPVDYGYLGIERDTIEQWGAKTKLNPGLRKRKADHFRMGEKVKVIIINRSSGYIGTTEAEIGFEEDDDPETPPLIHFSPERIILRPPNLKIKAERVFQIKSGLTKGEERNSIIGFEGSALTNDDYIMVSTEWLDWDDKPLPDDLPGYTGRLSVISDQYEFNQISNFGISPGVNTQTLYLPTTHVSSQHYYIHVNGQPIQKNPDFSTTGAGEDLLAYRPKHYVPVLVAIYDEEESLKQRITLRKAVQENKADEMELKNLLPVYQWVYRPEMQFSLYDLEVNAINRIDMDGEEHDILAAGSDDNEETLPAFSSSDQKAELLYSLFIESNIESLETFGPPKELIFAFGAEELEATISDNQKIEFTNLDHITELEVEDYATITLYNNGDDANILWEFAFEYLGLDTKTIGDDMEDAETGYYYLSADNPELDFHAILAGYAYRDPSKKIPRTVTFYTEGAGNMYPSVVRDNDLGVFNSKLIMPCQAGSEATVVAALKSDPIIKAVYSKILVIPGKPASAEVEMSGSASAMGHGTIDVDVIVKDSCGNLVADNTSVDLFLEGDAVLESYDPGTKNGVVTAKIRGVEFASKDNQLYAKVGDLEKTFDLTIHPLNVAFQETPDKNMIVNTLVPFSVLVKDHEGNPAPGTMVSFSSNLGRFNINPVETDENGYASNMFHTGFQRGQGTINVRCGYAGGAEYNFSVDLPPGKDSIDVNYSLLIGDEKTDGNIVHTGYDGTTSEIPYKTHTSIKISGSAGETKTIRLGDLADPNIEPLLAFYMNDIVEEDGKNVAPDELGLHNAIAENVDVAHDNPIGVGYSYLFDSSQNSKLSVPASENINPKQSSGFRFDFKPTKKGGTLFSSENGVQQLEYTLDGRLIYSIVTSTGEYQVTSDIDLTLNTWHTIAGRYFNGKLELVVDGQASTPVAANGELFYKSPNYGLDIGVHINGMLNSFRWYDWSSKPLVTFSNGTDQIDIHFDQAETISLELFSTGEMGKKQNDSALKALRIAIFDNQSRVYLSVISKEAYALIIDNIIDVESLINNTHKRSTRIFSSLWETAKFAISFIIPYEDFIIVGQQLYYLAIGDMDKFNAVDLALSSLSVITVIPVAKPLKLVLNPLKKFLKLNGSKRIVKAIAGAVGKIAELAANRKTKKLGEMLENVLPYCEIVGYIILDPEARQIIPVMVNAIASSDDLWAWINYFNLPVEALIENSTKNQNGNVIASHNDGLVQRNKILRNKKKKLKDIMKKAFKRISESDDELIKNAREITYAFRITSKNFNKIVDKEIKKMVFDGQYLKASIALAKKGGKAAKEIIIGTKYDRVKPLYLFGCIAFLEEEIINKRINENVASEIRELYLKAAIDYSNWTLIKDNNRHASMFQITQVAVFHIQHIIGNNSPAVEAIEEDKLIYFYKDKTDRRINKYYFKFKRRVDIVLKGGKWIELKSYLKESNTKKFDNKFKRWIIDYYSESRNKGETICHKQFFKDRCGKSELKYPYRKFAWYFQSFKDSVGREGYDQIHVRKVKNKLCQWPSSKNKLIKASLNLHGNTFRKTNVAACKSILGAKIYLSDLEKELMRFGFKEFLPDIPDFSN
jgi:hypothetical protein